MSTKRIKSKISSTIAFFAALTLLACDDDAPVNKVADIKTKIITGDWLVTYFYDDTDETHYFSGYTFAFNDDGTAVATKGAEAISGTWSLQSASSGEKLILDFGPTEPLEELNDDWLVKEYTQTKIILEHVSGGNGGTDYVTFEKP